MKILLINVIFLLLLFHQIDLANSRVNLKIIVIIIMAANGFIFMIVHYYKLIIEAPVMMKIITPQLM